ncbi:MAG: hypothetical protein PHW87_06605 [Methanothrix sp.]|nr:hypothetical protein [Methanothrix sp.]
MRRRYFCRTIGRSTLPFPIPQHTVSILRAADGYKICVGPRVLDVDERIEGIFYHIRKIDENLSLILIGNHEIKIRTNVASKAFSHFLAKNDVISYFEK